MPRWLDPHVSNYSEQPRWQTEQKCVIREKRETANVEITINLFNCTVVLKSSTVSLKSFHE